VGPRFWATLSGGRAQFRALQVVRFLFLAPITRVYLPFNLSAKVAAYATLLRMPAAWSSATSFEILLLMADLRKVGQGETKDFSVLIS
jgi:hypothetical protein